MLRLLQNGKNADILVIIAGGTNCRRKGKYKGKNKCEVHPRTSDDGPEGEWRYSSILPLTLELDGVGDQRHASAATAGNYPVPIV